MQNCESVPKELRSSSEALEALRSSCETFCTSIFNKNEYRQPLLKIEFDMNLDSYRSMTLIQIDGDSFLRLALFIYFMGDYSYLMA